jgi:hypothetical protein
LVVCENEHGKPCKYWGEERNNKPHGFGCRVNNNGFQAHVGLFRKGKRHGWGRVVKYFGESTEGLYRYGSIHKDATQVNQEKFIYKGQVNQIEMRDGYGELYNPDG